LLEMIREDASRHQPGDTSADYDGMLTKTAHVSSPRRIRRPRPSFEPPEVVAPYDANS
jgi:hypothetical protein